MSSEIVDKPVARCLICEDEQKPCPTCIAAANKAVRADLADDVRYIAAHEPDPRKEDVLYEAADYIEQLEREVARKDEALRSIAEIKAKPIGDSGFEQCSVILLNRTRDIARAALQQKEKG